MTLSKCPRCELNYILEGEQYCKICRLEMKGEPVRDEIEMCTVCGEHPAMPGKDVCLFCLKEMSGNDPEEENSGITVTEETLGIDPISTMDEIIPDSNDEDGDMSLEALGEEEEEEDDDDNEDDDDGFVRKTRK